MAVINKLDNAASVSYGGETLNSETVTTLLELPPTITKVVDKATAGIGDTLTYTVTVTNVGLTEMTDIAFTDALPAGATYVADSFKVNTQAATPTVTGNVISYTLPSIAASGVAAISFQVNVVGGTV